MHKPEEKGDLNKKKDVCKKEQTPPVEDNEDELKGTRFADYNKRVEPDVIE
jgi:hypothetical protein